MSTTTSSFAEVVTRLREERQGLMDKLEGLITTAESEKRDLNDEERKGKDEALSEIDAIDSRLAELHDIEARKEKAAEYVRGLERKPGEQVQVGTEPRTYSKDAERRGVSFLRDLANQRRDPGAVERLSRHMREAQDHELRNWTETRDVGTGAFAGLTVPQYLTDLVAPLARAGRPTADICNKHPLPDDGMTVNISRITTGTATAAQATENSAVQETNADDTLLTVNVNTIAGMQDVSRQAVDRGTGIDEIILADLVAAYNTTLDDQILDADGTGGTHLGIRSTTSIVAVTYTDASATAAEAWPKLWDLVSQVQAGVFMGLSHFIMHPRRFWWLVSQVGTSFPFIHMDPAIVTVQAGEVATLTYGDGPSGRLGPIPVVLDGNMQTNLGAGTNEDVILGVTARELHLWEDANAPLLIRSEDVLGNQLSVRFVVYGYSAFTAGRYPGAHGTIGGTGFILPVF